ncbi:Vanillate O-demethylase ferredoxin subunit OS=Castellaniella defragrans OX=75697 GN=HNR28_001895 PE=4 SV=1 [Castellaniella defragrans]
MGAGEYRVQVQGLRKMNEEVLEVTLTASESGRLPNWSAGAHIAVVIKEGVERQYSLCGDVEEQGLWKLAIRKHERGRGGSAYLHENLREGDLIWVKGPTNNFPLQLAERYFFIAGGIGITPLIPMIRIISKIGKPWKLAYGGRRRATMAYINELCADKEHVVAYCGDSGKHIDVKQIIGQLDRQTDVYCCGPERLMREVEDECRGVGNVGRFFAERFQPRQELRRENQEFTVTVASSGQKIVVGRDETIAEALERSGVEVTLSCREGTCGTCMTGVLDGVPEHRDSVLTDEEKRSHGLVMVCCARSLSENLTLDL